MTEELKTTLRFLADKYETADFLKNDPAQFMHKYATNRDKETAAFIAANLAFGKREQILSHVDAILTNAAPSPSKWICEEKFLSFFPDDEKSFYRIFTNRDLRIFCQTLKKILDEFETLGDFFKEKRKQSDKKHIFQTVADFFPKNCALIPHSAQTAAKKLNMLLRWLVRQNSPVDIGTWNWANANELLIPLDTHVMRQAANFGLISENAKSANLSVAENLTKKLEEAFPLDPVRGDFALFGLGVNKYNLEIAL